MVGEARLRPRSVTDIIDATFVLYRRNFALFAGVVALLAIPETILSMALAAVITAPAATGTNITSMLQFENTYAAYGATAGIRGLMGIVFGTLITGALAEVISQRFLGRPSGVLEAYRSVGVGPFLRLLLALVVGTLAATIGFGIIIGAITLGTVLLSQVSSAAAVLFGLGAGLGFTALLVWVPIHFLFVPQVIVLERTGTLRAFRRSWELVAGSVGRVLGLFLLAVILVGIITGILGGFSQVLALGYPVIATGIGGVLGILVQPIEWAAFTLLYYDQRIRKEGFDLEFAVRHAPGQPWPPTSYSP